MSLTKEDLQNIKTVVKEIVSQEITQSGERLRGEIKESEERVTSKLRKEIAQSEIRLKNHITHEIEENNAIIGEVIMKNYPDRNEVKIMIKKEK